VNENARIRIPHSDNHVFYQRDKTLFWHLFFIPITDDISHHFSSSDLLPNQAVFIAILTGSSSLLPTDILHWRHRKKFHWSTPFTYPSNCSATPFNAPPYIPLSSYSHPLNTYVETDTHVMNFNSVERFAAETEADDRPLHLSLSLLYLRIHIQL
jgi:hypothetical protein